MLLVPPKLSKISFSCSSVNFKEPIRSYHWNVLPQGMANMLRYARSLWLRLYKLLEINFHNFISSING